MILPRDRGRVVRLTNKDGLNLRGAALLSQQARRFPCQIRISSEARRADAKSLWELLSLIAMPDSELLREADGPQSQEALDCLETVVVHQFAGDSTAEATRQQRP